VSASLSLTLPLVALLLLLAVTSAVMARGGFAGSLRRAGRLGVHSPAAMASDEAFATANKVAAPVAAGAAATAAVVAVLLLVLAPSTATALVIAVVGLVGSGALLLAAGVLGDRAARLVPIPAAAPATGPGAGPGAGCGGCGCGSGGCAGLTRTDPAQAAGQA
jgi:hypothetical protein